MSDVWAVLLVPAEGHEALLAEGPCGARPPVAVRQEMAYGPARWHPWPDAGNHDRDTPISDVLGRGHPVALVLAWDGKLVPAGCVPLAEALPVSFSRALPAVLEAVREAVAEGALGRLNALVRHHELGDLLSLNDRREATP